MKGCGAEGHRPEWSMRPPQAQVFTLTSVCTCVDSSLYSLGMGVTLGGRRSYMYRTAPLLLPPTFATYFQEKEEGGGA